MPTTTTMHAQMDHSLIMRAWPVTNVPYSEGTQVHVACGFPISVADLKFPKFTYTENSTKALTSFPPLEKPAFDLYSLSLAFITFLAC